MHVPCVQALESQQGCPTAPQATQVWLWQTFPALQAAVQLPPQPFNPPPHLSVQFGEHTPHTFWTPPPPQVWGELQVPQLTVREDPQLSFAVTLSQFLFSRVQNAVLPS